MAAKKWRYCELCSEFFSSGLALCRHMLSDKHRWNLQCTDPGELMKQTRLEYFLETHLKGEAIVGLEYIEEVQLGPSSFEYSCHLCEMKDCLLQTFYHIVDPDHIMRYLGRHHAPLLPNPNNYLSRSAYLQALTATASKIHSMFGRKQIQYRSVDEVGNSSAVAREIQLSPEENDFDLLSAGKIVMDDWSCLQITVLQEAPQQEDAVEEASSMQEEEPEPKEESEPKEDDSEDCLTSVATQGCTCTLCSVSYKSALELYHHVLAHKHKMNLAHTEPEKVKELTRLKCILDTYMMDEPTLGLEYIVEMRLQSSVYCYLCQLCNVKKSLLHIFRHIVSRRHVESYIKRHYSSLWPKEECYKDSFVLNKAIRAAALYIQKICGRNEIQLEEEIVSAAPAKVIRMYSKNSHEENDPFLFKDKVEQEVDLGLLQRTLQNSPQRDEDVDEDETVSSQELKFRRAENSCRNLKKFRNRSCSICFVTCSSILALCDHIMGSKHRMALEEATSQKVEKGRLKYLLDTNLKDYPFLGLEYILETQKDYLYQYVCMLCNVEGDWRQTFIHLTSADHMALYLDRHHRTLSVKPEKFNMRAEYVRTLRSIAFNLIKCNGRQEIRSIPASSPPPTEEFQGSPEDCGGEHNPSLCKRIVIPKKQLLMQQSSEERTPVEDRSRKNELEDTYIDGPPPAKLTRRPPVKVKNSNATLLHKHKAVKKVHKSPPMTSLKSILRKYRMNSLGLQTIDNDGSPSVEGATVSPNKANHNKDETLLHEDHSGEGTPPHNLLQQEAEQEDLTPLEELQFGRNLDFLKYLTNFEIHNNEDASYIWRINKNCTDALLRFWTEQETEEELQRTDFNEASNFPVCKPESSCNTVTLLRQSSLR